MSPQIIICIYKYTRMYSYLVPLKHTHTHTDGRILCTVCSIPCIFLLAVHLGDDFISFRQELLLSLEWLHPVLLWLLQHAQNLVPF